MTNPLVDAIGTHRRIRALMTQGWSLPVLTERIGYCTQSILKRPQVRATTASDFAELYSRLRDLIGPAPRVRHYADKHLYLPVHAWDHGYIDDPRQAAETEALTVWLEVAPDPAIPGGPMVLLLGRLDTLLPRERAAVARRAHALYYAGDHRDVVERGEQLCRLDTNHHQRDYTEGAAAA